MWVLPVSVGISERYDTYSSCKLGTLILLGKGLWLTQ